MLNKKIAIEFLYLNIYSFIVLFTGILVFVLQAVIAIKLLFISTELFKTWDYKKREIALLYKRNFAVFRADTFKIYMEAPCGRLVVRDVLKRLGKQSEYKNLLKLKVPLKERIRNGCVPQKTVI